MKLLNGVRSELEKRIMVISKVLKQMGFILLCILAGDAYSKAMMKTVVLENVTIHYHFMDRKSVEKESEINQLTQRAFAVYSEFFGGLPRDKAGVEYSEIDIHVNNAKYLGGEADPGLVVLSWNDSKQFGFASWQTILLHELFHLWNAESFRYQDGSEHWFNEGVTEFYAFKTAVELGVISPEEMLMVASTVAGYYASSSGIGNISMRQAGKTNKDKFNNYFLVYGGGWLVSMALDHDIRLRTNSKKSLDDVMRWMYVNFPRHEKLYGLDDILVGLRQNTGIDYSPFIERYVEGHEVLPISEYLPLGDALWALTFNKKTKTNYKALFDTLNISVSN